MPADLNNFGLSLERNPMQHYVSANFFAPQLLRKIGKDIYAQMRLCPVNRLTLEMGEVVSQIGPNESHIQIYLHDAADRAYVHIHDQSFSSIQVGLPQTTHWAKDGFVVPEAPWLNVIIADANSGDTLPVLHELYDGRVTITQLAKLTHRAPRRLVSEISQAIIRNATRSEKLLTQAVSFSKKKPANWMIDIRGYAASKLIDEIIPVSANPDAVLGNGSEDNPDLLE